MVSELVRNELPMSNIANMAAETVLNGQFRQHWRAIETFTMAAETMLNGRFRQHWRAIRSYSNSNNCEHMGSTEGWPVVLVTVSSLAVTTM